LLYTAYTNERRLAGFFIKSLYKLHKPSGIKLILDRVKGLFIFLGYCIKAISPQKYSGLVFSRSGLCFRIFAADGHLLSKYG
jgi:hypothetical protein